MKKFLFLLIIGFVSCQSAGKKKNNETRLLDLAQKYYKALDTSDGMLMRSVLGDSIVVREAEDDYEERFSMEGYITWLEWDAVFDPTYKMLEMEEDNNIIKSKISKIDKRIQFLNEEPIVWNEIIRFDDQKITRIERIKYEDFRIEKFLQNRDKLVQWIDKNHPELSGFLYPQTSASGMKYLKAIEFYENRSNTQ